MSVATEPADTTGPERPRGAVVARLAGQLRRRFEQGRRRIGHEAWMAWWKTIAAGFLLLLVILAALIISAQRLHATGQLDWERRFLLWIGEHAPFSFADAVFFQTFGSDPALIILVGFAAAIAIWLRRPITALSIVLAPLAVDVVGRVGWTVWARTRPDLLYDGVASPAFHSFPSGHTSKTTAAYGFLTLLWVRASGSTLERTLAGSLLLLIVVAVPVGRIGMGVHWPSDVAGGFILGVAWLAVLRYGLRFERT
jgi:membrane-associated phospholipid phosphatase